MKNNEKYIITTTDDFVCCSVPKFKIIGAVGIRDTEYDKYKSDAISTLLKVNIEGEKLNLLFESYRDIEIFEEFLEPKDFIDDLVNEKISLGFKSKRELSYFINYINSNLTHIKRKINIGEMWNEYYEKTFEYGRCILNGCKEENKFMPWLEEECNAKSKILWWKDIGMIKK